MKAVRAMFKCFPRCMLWNLAPIAVAALLVTGLDTLRSGSQHEDGQASVSAAKETLHGVKDASVSTSTTSP